MAEIEKNPLVVDLDGTLILTDMMWESLAQLLRRNPFAIFQICFWLLGGRARLKQKLAARVQVDPATLPYHKEFLEWLRSEKKSGRKLILATASDIKMAQPIANHVAVFDEVLGSDGKTNLRSANKLRALTEKFGERGFDYAGNSTADFAVWRGSRQAVVVNASRSVLDRARQCTTLGPTFCEGFSHFTVGLRVGQELLWRSGYLLAAFAGLLLAVAFPKINLAGFAWVAPALVLFAMRGKTGADAFRVGYVFGLVFWLTSLYWLLYMPVAGLPILGWTLLSAFIALYFAAWAWLVSGHTTQSSWSQRTRWALGGAAAWVALEMIRARFLGGFPWSFLGASQYKLVPLIQIASVTGVYGISFLVIWFSLALYSSAEMILREPTKKFVWQAEIALPLCATMICFIGGFFQMNAGAPATDSLRITLVQPNIPQTVIWDPIGSETNFQKFLAQNRAVLTNHTDLLIWPESAVPDLGQENCNLISALVREHNLWLVLNGEDLSISQIATNYYNAAFLVGPDGKLLDVYHKQNLVIFGEYIPLVHYLPFLHWFTPITDGWTPGDKPVTFQIDHTGVNNDDAFNSTNHVISVGDSSTVRKVKLSPLICFEDTFATTTRQASQEDIDLLVNITNDGWFGQSAEQWQHLANSVFRAIENGVPLVRSCNNGITCCIDSHGRLLNILRDQNGSEYGQGAITFDLPLLSPGQKSAPTYYNRHGDCFGWSCVAASALLLGGKFRRRRS